MAAYDHKSIEQKWQKRFEDAGVFGASEKSEKPKFYALMEFPYPSGAGLHVGHVRGYTAMDIIARKRRMDGYNVLYPIGWDAFGLPTENYAIKTGRKPADVTAENVATFKKQMKAIGLSFDWEREINTSDPSYYKWTQWMFLEFFKAGLAYKKAMPINWCVSCKIGLANEEVVGGACERCGGAVEKRNKEQWMIRITDYAERLINDLETVDYLEKIKKQQIDWIGRSEGAEIEFVIANNASVIASSPSVIASSTKQSYASVRVFTTRPDTLFGATYLVLAPEHPLLLELLSLLPELLHSLPPEPVEGHISNADEVRAYIKAAAAKTDIERGSDEREKTGVELKGIQAINPATNEEIPIWIADYVLPHYGTGAIMAVPAHDERDFAFAEKYGLPVCTVVESSDVVTDPPSVVASRPTVIASSTKQSHSYECYSGEGININSDFLNGLETADAKRKVIEWLEEKGIGRGTVQYKLRDWVFSRQRYWGEPIPLVHCDSCSPEADGWVPVPSDELPVTLPDVEKYEPTDSGESPLAAMQDWVNTKCPQCGGSARRETDTMPNWAGSSWYFLRYLDVHNKKAFAAPEKLKKWMPVDWYNGGMEHTTLHLLYSRFWNKFLYDRGHVPTSEPYAKRTSHGMILAADGSKMSKSKGNVVNPNDIMESHGADTLRMYEMFMGPFDQPVPWSEQGVVGVHKFLKRVFGLLEKVDERESPEVVKALHKTIKKVTEDVEAMRFNTAISQMMIFVNTVYDAGGLSRNSLQEFVLTLSPFAPHIAEEIWEKAGGQGLACTQAWPAYDAALVKDEIVTIGVQVNGKVRGDITIAADASEEEVRQAALANPNVAKYLEGKTIKKFLYIPARIVNFVVEMKTQPS